MNSLTLHTLTEGDKPVVEHWLRLYLEQHLSWWSAAYGTEPRIPLTHLITRE